MIMHPSISISPSIHPLATITVQLEVGVLVVIGNSDLLLLHHHHHHHYYYYYYYYYYY